MRKVILVLIAMSLFVSVGYADDCDDCTDGELVDREGPIPGQDILNRRIYHASFVDVPCSGTACHGWVYLLGNTQYALDTQSEHVYAIVFQDDSNMEHIACAFLGDAITSDSLGDEELSDTELSDYWEGDDLDPDGPWEENEDPEDWGEITMEDDFGYPDDTTCAHYTTYENEEPETRKLNIHQDLYPSPGLIEGAYYFGSVRYRRLSEDDSLVAGMGLEVMSYFVQQKAMSGEEFAVDQNWQEFKGGNCFYVVPHTIPDHENHTPGHEITIPLARGNGNGEAIVDHASLKQQKLKLDGIQTSSTKGTSDGKWVYVDPEFRFNHIKYISIYELDAD